MTDRELMQMSLDWMDRNGEVVFAQSGLSAVLSMNLVAEALRARLAQPDDEPQWIYKVAVPESTEVHHWAVVMHDLDKTVEGWSEDVKLYYDGELVAPKPEPEPVACPKEPANIEELYTAPPQREHDKETDAVDTLTEEGWIWDGDQWQRPAQSEPPCKTGSQCIGGKCLRCIEPEPEQEQRYKDAPCIESDGRPTEKAVLQRFWRKHQQPEPEPVGWFSYDEKLAMWYEDTTDGEGAVPLYTAPPQRECECKHCGGLNVC